MIVIDLMLKNTFMRVLQVSCISLLLFVAAWIYWPGQYGPALLDDRGSLTILDVLNEDPGLAADIIFGDRSGKFGRPVSMATFVAEKLFADGEIAGIKRVNIGLHLANGLMVFWLYYLLLSHYFRRKVMWVAGVWSAVWLLSPLFVSTVLYAVQRMAMLSTFFMLCACVSYIYWRSSFLYRRFSLLKFLCIPGFVLLAVFSKENGLLVVPVIILLEVFWFQRASPHMSVGYVFHRLSWLLFILGCISVPIVLVFTHDWIVAGYATRDFTLVERLLTEQRILWDYVSQLIWPNILRMGVFHDDLLVSKSLTYPVTTLYALFGWSCVFIVSLFTVFRSEARIFVVPLFWFLIGHSMESSFLALELYFEHRNYFPAVGLFCFQHYCTLSYAASILRFRRHC